LYGVERDRAFGAQFSEAIFIEFGAVLCVLKDLGDDRKIERMFVNC
jgi:hypothetical protein